MNLQQMGERAIAAKYQLQKLTTKVKNKLLCDIADDLIKNADVILTENKKDIENGEKKGMHQGLLDRLRLTKERIEGMAEGLRQIAELADPVGEQLEQFVRPNGLTISKVVVPMGVIGIIYESRPNVTADAFGLCFKTGNAVMLRGGSDAIYSNCAITLCIQNSLKRNGFITDAIQLIQDTSRETVSEFMKLNQYVDVLIPRGGEGLIKNVVNNSTIPVIETGTGNCHIYVDEYADLEKATSIIMNAKTQRIGVCNACESLVVHEKIGNQLFKILEPMLKSSLVEIRCDKTSSKWLQEATKATEEDFRTEYLDYIISVKTVTCIEEAISHINQYNTRHSDAIITENKDHAQLFKHEIDSACVYVNASTRFTDGFEFGFGAEIGISTQKLHARGPMGLKELTTYKYTIEGNGQIRS